MNNPSNVCNLLLQAARPMLIEYRRQVKAFCEMNGRTYEDSVEHLRRLLRNAVEDGEGKVSLLEAAIAVEKVLHARGWVTPFETTCLGAAMLDLAEAT